MGRGEGDENKWHIAVGNVGREEILTQSQLSKAISSKMNQDEEDGQERWVYELYLDHRKGSDGKRELKVLWWFIKLGTIG